ncbi:MAG: hypothetical protein B6D41_21615, partial [Chloroflexi bacterium UTCFX4]
MPQRAERGKTDAGDASVCAGGALELTAVVKRIYFDLGLGAARFVFAVVFFLGARLDLAAAVFDLARGWAGYSTESMPSACGPDEASHVMTCVS